jgi:hypothetical protein
MCGECLFSAVGAAVARTGVAGLGAKCVQMFVSRSHAILIFLFVDAPCVAHRYLAGMGWVAASSD